MKCGMCAHFGVKYASGHDWGPKNRDMPPFPIAVVRPPPALRWQCRCLDSIITRTVHPRDMSHFILVISRRTVHLRSCHHICGIGFLEVTELNRPLKDRSADYLSID